MVKALKDIRINPRIKIEKINNISFAVACRHCKDPLCVKSCISGALSINEGVISINEDKCVSCYTCVMICPYGAVMPTEEGVVQKCELCTKNLSGKPACVMGCPNNAIVFEERG